MWLMDDGLFMGGLSSKGFDATIVSPKPLIGGGGSRSCGVGGGCDNIALAAFAAAFAFDVFRRFFGLLGADMMFSDSVGGGGLKSGGQIPGPGSRYGAIPRLCVIIFLNLVLFILLIICLDYFL